MGTGTEKPKDMKLKIRQRRNEKEFQRRRRRKRNKKRQEQIPEKFTTTLNVHRTKNNNFLLKKQVFVNTTIIFYFKLIMVQTQT